ncbi:ferredoxin [Streptomyces iranensis]|uniref:Ferredoxin n=1 Tax=Streptomyces iranensis TaxID=576784 RepID=A0A060ZRF2_9ACTN|nr:ferredoxin [Streptomyces iranensis]MBP2061125.1 ferredoxin [Streptomyces iranensis]CDR05607.1 ferredoxin [Streptomyces iranensis]
MHVTGDREVCVGAGQCVFAAPDVFDQDEDEGLVLVLQEYPGEARRETVEEAADTCPSGAVRIG